jgi:hypothetical protein
MPLEQARVDGEFKHLRTVQQIIYNELLALKGAEFEALAKDAEMSSRTCLAKARRPPLRSTGILEDAKEKFKNWLEENEENEKRCGMSSPGKRPKI